MAVSPQHREKVIKDWVRRFGPDLMEFLRSQVDERETAEDLLQDVWVVAFRKFESRPPDDAVRAWLFSIAWRLASGERRTRNRRAGLLRRWAASLTGRQPDVNPPSIRRHLTIEAMWDEVSKLPGLEREVFLLRVVEGRTIRETAQVLGRAEGTVKSSFHRAIAKLRAVLEIPRAKAPRSGASKTDEEDEE